MAAPTVGTSRTGQVTGRATSRLPRAVLGRRRWSWPHYLAVAAIPVLFVQVWTVTAWLADGPRQVTEFRDRTSASWYAAHTVEAAMLVVAVAVIVHLVRDVRRQGRLLTFDVMFCLCGATLWWADEALNFWVPAFLPSSNFVNLTNPCGHLPLVVNPDCGQVPDAILFFFLVETFGVLGAAMVAGAGIRRLRNRFPELSTAQVVLIVFGIGLAIDVTWEMASVALGLWTYMLPHGMSLGQGARFPWIEALAGGIWFATFIVLRNFKDDRGRSFLERGLEHHSPRVGRGIALLAMYALFQFVMWVPGNLPQGLASFYAPQWPKMPPHLLNDACDAPGVVGTRYGPCPGSPGFRMPGRDSLPGRSP
jgi:hypothetical protein